MTDDKLTEWEQIWVKRQGALYKTFNDMAAKIRKYEEALQAIIHTTDKVSMIKTARNALKEDK